MIFSSVLGGETICEGEGGTEEKSVTVFLVYKLLMFDEGMAYSRMT